MREVLGARLAAMGCAVTALAPADAAAGDKGGREPELVLLDLAGLADKELDAVASRLGKVGAPPLLLLHDGEASLQTASLPPCDGLANRGDGNAALGMAIAAVLGSKQRSGATGNETPGRGTGPEAAVVNAAGILGRRGLLEFAVEGAGVGLWDWRLEDNSMAVNEFWAGMLGYRLAELEPLGLATFDRLVHPDDKPASDRITARYKALEIDTHQLELRMRHKDGHWVWILDRGRITERSVSGAPIRISGMHFDISSAKESELALQQSRDLLRLCVKSASLGLWDYHFDSGQASFSPEWVKMYGYAPGEVEALAGEGFRSLWHPEDRLRSDALMAACAEGRAERYECEGRIRHRDGRWIWFLAQGEIVERDGKGRPLHMVGTHLNISERKRAEADLAALVEQKQILLLELQHRVKNNLNLVISLLNLEMGRLPAGLENTVLRKTATRIHSMSSIYERLYAGPGLAKIGLGAYLGDLSRDLYTTCVTDPDSIGLVTELVDFQAEPKLAMPLGLILNELLTNAFKYAFPDGRRGRVAVRLLRDGEDCALLVEDDGVGFPPNPAPPQGDKLGSLIVESLARQIGGEIRRTGPGARVEILFKDAP
ncbi:MAG: PAS domain-containing protein [Spirochaetaceae bacterium]|nr:PAS domain-containing protein [Spirochaetaceae bacterium]